jgi:hypothetical protein
MFKLILIVYINLFFLEAKMRLLTGFLLSALSLETFALTPTITNASRENSVVTIMGANFEPENPMLFWDNVDKNLVTSNMNSGDIVPTSTAKWKQNSNKNEKPIKFLVSENAKAQISNEKAFYTGEGRSAFLGTPVHQTKDSLKNKIFVSWWYKPESSPSAEGGSNKFIRIWDDSNGNGVRISWTQMHLTCGEGNTSWGTWNGKVNEWNHHMFYVDLTAQKVKAWVNGTLVHNATCTKTTAYPDKLLYVGLIGFDHGSDAYKSMKTNFDDIYIGASLARVEISDSENWSETMTREVLPIVSWSPTKIVLTSYENASKFSAGQKYIYVYDANGISNKAGVKIKCDKCPKTPDGL